MVQFVVIIGDVMIVIIVADVVVAVVEAVGGVVLVSVGCAWNVSNVSCMMRCMIRLVGLPQNHLSV